MKIPTGQTNVLISLHRGYGLGDAVQMSAVLRHVVQAHPNWSIDYQADQGQHVCGRGIVANTYAYGDRRPKPHYDTEVQIVLYDTWHGYSDRPNTRVSSCLRERFGLEWNTEYCRYRVDVSTDAAWKVRTLRDKPFVAVHYQGDSSPAKKNLTHEQASEVCSEIERLGHVPLILDWRCSSTLEHWRLWSPKTWGSDAEMVCAVVSQCRAFVGIDSGPGKCASATETPTLVVWTGHHPAPYHDPAPNTTHLVPQNYHSLEPVCNDLKVVEWFEQNYRVQQYSIDPVLEVKEWLARTLPRTQSRD